MLIEASDSALVVIDMQERLVPATQAPARITRNTQLLLRAAHTTSVPAIMTEQYPPRARPYYPGNNGAARDSAVIPKMHFSCMKDNNFENAIHLLDRRQTVLTGMEAYIYVFRTTANLVEGGFDVFAVSGATASQTLESKHACLPA